GVSGDACLPGCGPKMWLDGASGGRSVRSHLTPSGRWFSGDTQRLADRCCRRACYVARSPMMMAVTAPVRAQAALTVSLVIQRMPPVGMVRVLHQWVLSSVGCSQVEHQRRDWMVAPSSESITEPRKPAMAMVMRVPAVKVGT